MLSTLFLLAQEAEAEPSKTIYYIAGAALALWAVIVSFLGLRNAEFPGGARAARGVMALSAVLALTAMATAVITA
jgi:hypothetical protein